MVEAYITTDLKEDAIKDVLIKYLVVNDFFYSKNFQALTTEELYKILALRAEVFVVEQNCLYQDVDGKDVKVFIF